MAIFAMEDRYQTTDRIVLTSYIIPSCRYAYYGLSVVWPGIKRYGNYVTYIQLTQFISVLLYLAVSVHS